jgi:hypothetical protein
MKWTKELSRRCVAARARRRIAAATAPLPDEPAGKVFTPRPPRADFTIRIESARGERLQVKIYRWHGRAQTSDGQSVRQFCRGLEQLITKSA